VVQGAKYRGGVVEKDGNFSAPIRILRMLSRNRAAHTYDATESNFLHAAMHVACLKDFYYPQDHFPDLPDRIEKLKEAYV